MLQQASALERIIRPAEGSLPPEVAAYILSLDFPPSDRSRYEALSMKAQDGTLTDDEKTDLDDLLTANDVLAILQSKARTSLQRGNPAA